MFNFNTFENEKNSLKSFLQCPDFSTFIPHTVEKEGETFHTSDYPDTCYTCKHFKKCVSLKEKIFFHGDQVYFSANTAIRFELNGDVEVVRYDRDYKIPIRAEEFGDSFDADRSPLYIDTENGLVPVKDCFTLQKAYDSIHNSEVRSLQKFYSYALANNWEYFLTLTFDPQYVDRFNRDEVVNKWSTFQKWIKRKNPDARILVAPEFHADGSLHFHGFMSHIPFVTFIPAFNQKESKYIYNDFTGLPTLNLKDWTYGFSTADVILPESNRLRVANYLVKYLTKMDSSQYRKKRYFHTRNLDSCTQTNYLINQEDFEDVIKEFKLEPVKTSSAFTVYRGVQKTDI